MRLTSLRLERYGHFEDVRVELSPAPGRLNVIYAPNGAGKSVFREALSDLLFGIGGQSPMGFRFDYKGLRLSAEALADDGRFFSFGRRKGQGNTLIDAQGKQAEAALLAPHLGATDRRALEQLFALDTRKLREGGEGMLKSGGLIADALLSAGGLPHAHNLRRELDRLADDLAPSRKSAGKPFYVAAERFLDARAVAARAEMAPDAWNGLKRELDEAETALTEASQKTARALAAKTRLERLRRTRPTLAALDAAQAWLDANPDAPSLPPGLRERLSVAETNLANAREKWRAESSRRDALDEERRGIPYDEALLKHAEAIEQLAEHAGAVSKALADLPARSGELGELEAAIGRTCGSLGSPAALPASLIPPRAVITRARALIREHGTHVTACREAANWQREIAGKIESQRALRDSAPIIADCSALAALIERIRAQGDPASAIRDVTTRLAARQAALQSAMAALASRTGGVDALRALAMPSLPLLERTHAELARVETMLGRHTEQHETALARLDDAQATLDNIVGGIIVPDRAAVAAARADRQRLWALVARCAFGDAPPSDAELDFLEGRSLAAAYEGAVAHADAIADRRADESALVEQARSAVLAVEQARASSRKAETLLQSSADEHSRALQAWQSLLPSEMPAAFRLDDIKNFIANRARVIERWEELQGACTEKAELDARQKQWIAELNRLLPGASSQDLAGLLAEAQRNVKKAQDAASEADKLKLTIAQLEVQLTGAQEKCRQTDAERDAWNTQWAASLAALGRPEDEAPGTTEDILGYLTDLDANIGRAHTLRTRIGDMRADNERFAENVAALCEACAQPLAEIGAGDNHVEMALVRLRNLRNALAAAREAESRRGTLRSQLEQADRQIAGLARTRDARATEYAGMLAAIGAATQVEAEMRLSLAEERARHDDLARQARARLLEDGDGIEIATLRAELEAASVEDVARDLYAVDAEAREAQEEVAEYAAAAALIRQSLSQKEVETTYADAVTARNEAAAAVDRILREALVARVAASLLAGAMEEVESQGTPEMLRRIDRWFGRITGGAYKEVGVEHTDAGMALLLTESAFPDRPKSVGGLSEGTRDQLYLALRLAAIETHPVALPFIADDILQTSDDERAEAALGALLELTDRTQVILLTHHRHIAELATSRFAEAVNMVSLN